MALKSDSINRTALHERFDSYLESHNLRKTQERKMIAECAFGFESRFTMVQLSAAVTEKRYYVSRASLYNTVRLMVDAKIVHGLELGGREVTYEFTDVSPMVQLVCNECGKVKAVRDNNFIAFMNAKKFSTFTTSYYTLTVYGTCNACARRRKRKQAAEALRKMKAERKERMLKMKMPNQKIDKS